MASPAIPSNLVAQQGNLKVYLSWDASLGATGYQINRSTDNINFTSIAAGYTPNSYIDSTALVGVKYYYTVEAEGSPNSPPCSSQIAIPAPNGELSLAELRLRAQQRADMVNSQYVTNAEWNFFINQSMYELYDILITAYQDYFEAPEVSFTTTGSQYTYPLPDGALSFTDSQTNLTIVAPPFYKLSGVDLGLQTANNAFVTVGRYNLIDRNRYVFPNTASTIFGVFNLQYRLMGNNIRFIPTPSNSQVIRLLYIPRLPQMLADEDLTTIGYSGWLQYVIVRAAKYALDKQEADTGKLDSELSFLNKRIEETAINRDAGRPDTISDTRGGGGRDGMGGLGGAFPTGGW